MRRRRLRPGSSWHSDVDGFRERYDLTRPFVLYPTARLAAPAEPLVGAAAVHALLAGWRAALQPAAGERAGAAVGAGS